MATKKGLRRLRRRIEDWNHITEDGALWGGKVKMARGYAYRKPGSQKK